MAGSLGPIPLPEAGQKQSGYFTFQAGSTLSLNLGGTGISQFDRLTPFQFTAGGNLNLTFLNGFGNVVSPSDTFIIVDASLSTITGAFANVARSIGAQAFLTLGVAAVEGEPVDFGEEPGGGAALQLRRLHRAAEDDRPPPLDAAVRDAQPVVLHEHEALQELGRIERSLFMIDWLESPELRRRCQAGLNKSEQRHFLAQEICTFNQGRIADRASEAQQFRASGLNLVIAAIVYWNSTYIADAVAHLRANEAIDDALLAHTTPLSGSTSD